MACTSRRILLLLTLVVLPLLLLVFVLGEYGQVWRRWERVRRDEAVIPSPSPLPIFNTTSVVVAKVGEDSAYQLLSATRVLERGRGNRGEEGRGEKRGEEKSTEQAGAHQLSMAASSPPSRTSALSLTGYRPVRGRKGFDLPPGPPPPEWERAVFEVGPFSRPRPALPYLHPANVSFPLVWRSLPTSICADKKKVIAFGVFSTSPQSSHNVYTRGLLTNIRSSQSAYPGWYVRVYLDDRLFEPSFRASFQLELGQYSSFVEVVTPSSLPSMKKVMAVTQRFLIFDDDSVDVYIVRDVDSRFSQREVDAVEEWLQSGYGYHCMRDSPKHNYAIIAGMWGGRNDVVGMQRGGERKGRGARRGGGGGGMQEGKVSNGGREKSNRGEVGEKREVSRSKVSEEGGERKRESGRAEERRAKTGSTAIVSKGERARPTMLQLLSSYLPSTSPHRPTSDYEGDQRFLTLHVYPIISDNMISHDSFFCLIYANGHPFPTPRFGLDTVGSQYGADGQPKIEVEKRMKMYAAAYRRGVPVDCRVAAEYVYG